MESLNKKGNLRNLKKIIIFTGVLHYSFLVKLTMVDKIEMELLVSSLFALSLFSRGQKGG